MAAPPYPETRTGNVNNIDPLQQLRDVHLPEAVSAWPPAYGWWLLATAIVILLSIIVRYVWAAYQRRAFLRESIIILQAMPLKKGLTPSQKLHHCNDVLKRCAIELYPLDNVATLSGEQWLHFLNTHSRKPLFENIDDWLSLWYKQDVSITLCDDFIQRSEQWLRQQRIGKSYV
jgi:hypothetical protein